MFLSTSIRLVLSSPCLLEKNNEAFFAALTFSFAHAAMYHAFIYSVSAKFLDEEVEIETFLVLPTPCAYANLGFDTNRLKLI